MITKLKSMLEAHALKSAAREYARLLGERLRQDYGTQKHYTAGQIQAAATKCRLPMQHVSIGCAAFMSEQAFQELAEGGDYQPLRNLFRRHSGAKRGAAFEPAASNSHDASESYGSSRPGLD